MNVVTLIASTITGLQSETGYAIVSPTGKLLLYDINGVQEIPAEDGGGSLVYVRGRDRPHRVMETVELVAAKVREARKGL